MSTPKSESKTTQLLLSLGTAPLLLGLVAGQTIASLIRDLGEASEEVFRGDRLPILKLSQQTDQDKRE